MKDILYGTTGGLLMGLMFLPPKPPPPDVTAICNLRGTTPTQEAEVSVFVTSTYDDAHNRAEALIISKVTGAFDEQGFSCGYEQIGTVRITKKQ